MDFTNLENDAREAMLEFPDHCMLVRFFNFQRKRRGETPITSKNSPIIEQLSENFPDIEFNRHGRRSRDIKIIARVKDGVSGSLVERIGFVSRQIPHLATTPVICADRIQVIFRADGVGVIKESSLYEFFEHDLDVKEVMRVFENDRNSLDDFLKRHFKEQINPWLEDPFIDLGDEAELHFEKGSMEELERLMKLFILTDPDIEAHEGKWVSIMTAMEGETDHPYLDEDDYYSERLKALMEIALSENRPVGWTWDDEFDGNHNRLSGNSKEPIHLTWRIGEILAQASAREKMAARRDLRQWLEERGHDIARFDALAEGKSVA
jgi:hypothetical protein